MGGAGASLLRGFAFALAAGVGLLIGTAPELAAALGHTSWLATLLPDDPFTVAVWIAIAALNAGAMFALAGLVEE